METFDQNLGASTVKWTTPYPCLVLSESDSMLYSNFAFVKRQIIKKKSQNHVDLQSQAIYDEKKISKKSLHVLEDGASGMQVVVINQVIAQIIIKI